MRHLFSCSAPRPNVTLPVSPDIEVYYRVACEDIMRPMNDSSKEPRKVRFGIMCNGTSFQAWQAACLGRLLALENVEPALLIVDDEPSDYGGLAGYVRKLRNLRNLFWYV